MDSAAHDDEDQDYDEDAASSVEGTRPMTSQQQEQGARGVATPDTEGTRRNTTSDEDDREAAAAAAEVAVMEGGNNSRRRDPTGDQALMGALNEEGGVPFEVVDESGELVQQAFLQFLQE
jgi:hypothetical protein